MLKCNNQHLYMTCFNKVHFGINATRIGKSMVYNKRVFCNEVYATNTKSFGTHATQVVIMDAIDSSSVCHQESKSNFYLNSNK